MLALPQRLRPPFSWVGHIPFAFHIVKILRPRILVELGVHTGNSFSAFCQAVSATKSPTLCYGVDTWRGDEHAGFYENAVYEELARDISLSYSDFAQLLRCTFDDALKSFSDGSVDLLHIDGLHTYEAVQHDFETWFPKLSDRGVVLFHDIAVRSDDFGVWKLWEEVKNNYPSFEFKHSHGLGVLLVGKQVPPELIQERDFAKNEPAYSALFERLGTSLRWLGEQDGAKRLLSVEAKAAALQHRLTQLGAKASNYGQLSLDFGEGFTEENTVRVEVRGDEQAIEFDLQQLRRGPINEARLTPFNDPVAFQLVRIEIVDAAGEGHTIFDYSTNKSFEDEGTLVFEHDQPEIRFHLDGFLQPKSLIVHLQFVAFGLKLQEYLHRRIQRAISECGLIFSAATGRIFLTPQFSDQNLSPESGKADGNTPKPARPRAFDEKLLAAAVFLHKELRAKDTIIQQKTAELREKEAALSDQESHLQYELSKLGQNAAHAPKTSALVYRPRQQATGDKFRNRLLATEYTLNGEVDRQREQIEDLRRKLIEEESRYHQVVTEKDRVFRELENYTQAAMADRNHRIAQLEQEIERLRASDDYRNFEKECEESQAGWRSRLSRALNARPREN